MLLTRAALLLSGFLPAAAHSQAPEPLALVGGTLIDGTERAPVPDGIIVVRNGSIACAGTRRQCSVPNGVRTLDVTGKFITPGLVDTHVHMSQTGWVDGRPDGLRTNTVYPYAKTIAELRADPDRWHRAFLCSGVTAAYDVGGMPWTVSAAKAERGRRDRVNMRASGPLVTMAPRDKLNLPGEPTFVKLGPPKEAAKTVSWLRSIGVDAVKLWFLEPTDAERADVDARVIALGAAVRGAGLPFLVHATELREAKVALRAGATHLVHGVSDRLIDDQFLELLARNKASYNPTLTVGNKGARALASIYFGEAVRFDDPNHCTAPTTTAMASDPKRARPDLSPEITAHQVYNALAYNGGLHVIGLENLRRVHAAGGRIVFGTDAGNPLTVHGASVYAELERMEKAGIPAAALVRIATRNGAALMGDLDRFGTLESGKQADLLVLAEDPTKGVKAFRALTHVMRGGLLREQKELRAR